ncbi:MAG: hypothetical protein LBV43_02730 [Prevotella sp.]|jgi:hypothetical protein|nr:hypothetical protein [Prevotella sp.]
MNKIILFFILFTLPLLCKAQCDLPYKPLSDFGTDTVTFMTYNFKDRADCYKGKTVEELTKDLQIPIKSYNRSISNYYRTRNFNIIGISIKTNANGIIGKNNGLKWHDRISLKFETPIERRIYEANVKRGASNDEVYNYIKDMKIKEISYISGKGFADSRIVRPSQRPIPKEKKDTLQGK